MLDVGLPRPPRFDLVFLRHFVVELDVRSAVQPEVGLLIGAHGPVRVGGDFPVGMS